MRKNIFKNLMIVACLASMMGIFTGCDRTLEATYKYDASEYVELGQYKDIQVNVDVNTIEANAVQKAVDSKLEKFIEYREIDRAAEIGDKMLLTFKGYIGGMLVEGFSNENYEYQVGTNAVIIEGFDDAVKGMKAGDFKIVTLKVPENFTENKEFAGASIVYEITCSAVAAPVYPQITDAWVKENLKYDTVDAFREAVKKENQATIDSAVKEAKALAATDIVYDNCKIKKEPTELISDLKSSLNMDFYATMYGMNVDAYCESRYGMKYDEFLRKSAVMQLAKQAIVKAENMTISEYYYKDHLDEFAREYAGTTDSASLVAEYGKDYIVSNMILAQAEDLIVDTAIIK